MEEFSVAFEIDPIPTAVVAIGACVSVVLELSQPSIMAVSLARWTQIISGRRLMCSH